MKIFDAKVVYIAFLHRLQRFIDIELGKRVSCHAYFKLFD